MRTWFAPLEMLDDNRVVAQHREIHTVMGSIMSVKRGYINHPVTKLYNGPHLNCLVSYHVYTQVEMRRRGWYGHKTSVSEAVIDLASARMTDETCVDWDDHVDKVVPVDGAYSLNADVHDLIERWTNERKLLRNDIAKNVVIAHSLSCQSACCVTYATSLVAEFADREKQQAETGMLIPTKGNASLHGALELLGDI